MKRRERMSKKCVNCGQSLPEDASFCPHCTAVQNEKKEVIPPRRWKKKAVTVLAVLIVVAAVGLAFFMHYSPKAYEGGAQVDYPDKEKTYKILLTYSQSDGENGASQEERIDTLSEGMQSALPCQMYVFDQKTGKLAWEEFNGKVESCKVETKPDENSKKMEFVDPVHNENFPNAAYVSDISFFSDSGTNDIVWTLNMKNGDIISLSTRLTIEQQAAVTYSAEDTPMENSEELNALLISIEEELPSDTPVYLHLPAVTYEGEITFGDRVWGIYGNTDGDEATTFTGTVNMKGQNGNYADLSGIRFLGNTGTGLNAYCFVTLSRCCFEGWDIAAMSQNGAWVAAMDCTFADNDTALKFNTSIAYGTSSNYENNTFTGNKTAVCIDNLPGDEVLNFTGSTFTGNDTDIENKAGHPVDTANAVFE